VYTLGSETELDLRVVVDNRGDDALEAVTRIFIPPELEYINVDLVRAPVSRVS
jgi:Integrin alpha